MTYQNPFKKEQPQQLKSATQPASPMLDTMQTVTQCHHFYTRPHEKIGSVEWMAREIRKQYGPNVLIMAHTHPFGFECSAKECKLIKSKMD